MPRCSSCGAFTDDPVEEDNGRTVTVLCQMCAAESALKRDLPLRVDDLVPKTFWEKIKARWRGLFGR
ncbi:MAG: hypothetical protein KC910_06255 [Candidatus Eremiobacteraeota bacterium]|nr:hypothetical protein [Candidatus Eremiobacteraeota bacterium]